MIRHRERSSQSALGSGIIIALVIALPLLAVPRVAHADIGDEPSSSGTSKPGIDQVQDTDKPREPSLLETKPADAAVQKKAAPSEPIYTKWQFWAITGGILLGGALAILAGQQIAHQINGGDVRPCNMTEFIGCYGEGH